MKTLNNFDFKLQIEGLHYITPYLFSKENKNEIMSEARIYKHYAKTFINEFVTVYLINKSLISRESSVKYQKSKVSLINKLVINPFGIGQI